jgi:hypothetical protein
MAAALLAVGALGVPAVGATQARSDAPAAACLDARQMQEVRQADPRTLAVLTADGRRFRLQLGSDCPGVDASADATLLAREGWVCGREREFVRTDTALCPITGLETIGPKDYAALTRQSQEEGVATLETVEVRGQRRKGFAGSYSYCFNPRYLRAWSEDTRGLLVEMSPRRAGGNRFYRVELAQSCPDLDSAPAITFRSGVGIGLICGNAGDEVKAETDGISPARQRLSTRCSVSAVYPYQPGRD